MSRLVIVILAAGAGTRMHSDRPKVLHKLAGQSLLEHVVDTASALAPEKIITIYGHGGDLLPQTLPELALEWVEQKERRGTGHAVMQALPVVKDSADHMLVLYGDVPLLRSETLQTLLAQQHEDRLLLLTAVLEQATGYGRIVRDHEGKVTAIVEEADADSRTRAIKEVNTGIMLIPMKHITGWLAALGNDNKQHEFYLTDIVALAVKEGVEVAAVTVEQLGAGHAH